MNLLIAKSQDSVEAGVEAGAGKVVALEDLVLTTALPTTGGSKMLEGYMSLFDAEVVGRLEAAVWM